MKFFIYFLLSVVFSQTVLANENSEHAHGEYASRADLHAPIGVMGDHTHKAGEVMFSYRYMRMEMSGSQQGNKKLSTADVLKTYMVTPEKMTTQMHMLGAMYAPNDKVTLMAMLPYVEKDMRMKMRNGNTFATSTEGVGDLKLGALVPVMQSQHQQMHVGLTLSVPTGAIDETVTTPMGENHAPYGMQLGSGTYDVMPSVTWVKQGVRSSVGAQGSAHIYTGKNDNDYRLGNSVQATTWGAYNVSPRVSVSARLTAKHSENIEGADKKIMRIISPTLDASSRARKSLGLGLGANFKVNDKHRLALEITKPIYEKLDGIQLEMDAGVNLAWQKNL